VPCCHTYRPQPIEHMRKPCYGSHTVTAGGVPKYEHSPQRPRTTKLVSDSLRRAIHLDPSVLATTSTIHRHTRQPEPQLKVPSVHPLSRATTQEKSFRATTYKMPCAYPYPEPQLKDTFRATTHGTPANSPSRYLRNIVDPPSSLKLQSIQYCNHLASEPIIHPPLGLNIQLSPKHSSTSRSG